MLNPTDSREWWRENWQLPGSWATCWRCGVKILRSHLADGVCRDTAECYATMARRPVPPDPVAAVRLADGSQVVAFQPAGIEVRAFTAEDLDERGFPRRQECLDKFPEKP